MAAFPNIGCIQRSGFQQTIKNNTIRSGMTYGPDKLRQRTTVPVYMVTIPMIVSTAEYSQLDTFYRDNQALAFDWVDHVTGAAAVYRFMGPPSYAEYAPGYWMASLNCEFEPV